jgi:hypothetical protein
MKKQKPKEKISKEIIAFEFGVMLSEVAKNKKVTLTKEIVVRAEEILESELKERGPERFALEMVPILLSVFEK